MIRAPVARTACVWGVDGRLRCAPESKGRDGGDGGDGHDGFIVEGFTEGKKKTDAISALQQVVAGDAGSAIHGAMKASSAVVPPLMRPVPR